MSRATDIRAACVEAWARVNARFTGYFFICEGNSLTAGQGGGETDYPTLLTASFSDATKTNLGVGSRTTQEIVADASTAVDPLLGSVNRKIVLLVWELRNDMYLNSVSVSQAVDNLETYCNARRAHGGLWKILVFSSIKMGGTSGTWTPTAYAALNAELRSRWATFADGLVDLGADARFQDNSDLTYYDVDAVHLNATGYTIVAGLVRDKILTL